MALRVLLADESSTIKKVIQLALHDYGVEVKTVPNGLDVMPVIKSYNPDIIFADVLLSKKSGYDVCADLKKEELAQKIPFVLMWSGFMEIDPVRFEQCGAKAKLEKPFDTNTLRSLVNQLVPKTISNPISAFLKFPKLPELIENQTEPTNTAHTSSIEPVQKLEVQPTDLPIENFEQVSLTKPKTPSASSETWSSENLAQFKIQVNPEVQNEKKFVIPEDEIEHIEIENYGDFEEVQFSNSPLKSSSSLKTTTPQSVSPSSSSSFSSSTVASQSENIKTNTTQQSPTHSIPISEEKLLLEARSIIESICWKILPDITEKIVREEIQKLMNETENGF